MRNILALIGAAVLVFAVLGWYFGWYQLGAEPAADGHRNINLNVNPQKIANDLKKGEQKVSDIITNETKGTSVSPAPPEKKVQGQTKGLQENPDRSWTINPQFKVIGN